MTPPIARSCPRTPKPIVSPAPIPSLRPAPLPSAPVACRLFAPCPVRLRHVTGEASLRQPFAGAASKAGLSELELALNPRRY